MSNTEERKNTESSATDDGERARIQRYNRVSRFRVGDRVKLINSDGTRDGPYYVESIVSIGVYTLSLADGQRVLDGEAVEEGDLKAA